MDKSTITHCQQVGLRSKKEKKVGWVDEALINKEQNAISNVSRTETNKVNQTSQGHTGMASFT